LEHRNYVCLIAFMVNYGLNKIELNFDAQYKVVTLTVYFITYLLYRALALALL